MKNWLFGALLMLGCGQLWAQTEYDWEIVFENENVTFTYIDFWDHLTATAVGKNGAVYRTDDGGESWVNQSDARFGDITCLEVTNPDTAFFTNGRKVFRTFDGGETWKEILTSFTPINTIRCELHNSNSLYVAGDSSLIMVSKNFGDTWYRKSPLAIMFQNENIIDLLAGPYRGDTSYALNTSVFDERITIDNLETIHENRDFSPNGEKLVDVNQCYEFSKPLMGLKWQLFDNNRFIYWSFAGVISSYEGSKEQINGGAFHYRWQDDLKFPLAYSVGNNGYIVKLKNFRFKALEQDTTSPTDKNLNWIDFGCHYFPKYKLHGNDIITFMSVGDGIIIRKRFDWKPGGVNVKNAPTAELKVNVFPNPANDLVNISITNHDENYQIDVISVDGKVVQSINANSSITQISGLQKGTYVIRIYSAEASVFKKLIIN
ncbi:MAG: T9SS type A sorting domain-containing protein [Bacteroidia bacterium]